MKNQLKVIEEVRRKSLELRKSLDSNSEYNDALERRVSEERVKRNKKKLRIVKALLIANPTSA